MTGETKIWNRCAIKLSDLNKGENNMITHKFNAWLPIDKKLVSCDIEVNSEGIGHRAYDGSFIKEIPEDAIFVPYCLLQK